MKQPLQDEHVELPYWEEICMRRKGLIYSSEIEQRAIMKAHHLMAKPSDALDIGCEGGRWSVFLSNLGWNMRCIDIDQSSLQLCQKRIPEATCILVHPDDQRFPCETEGVALELCIGVPAVIHANWFVAETYRVLRNGGLVVGLFWNRLSWRGIIHHGAAIVHKRHDAFYQSSYSGFRKSLVNAGFTLLHEEGYCWPPFARTSDSPLLPAAIQLEHALGLHHLTTLSPLVVFIARKEV